MSTSSVGPSIPCDALKQTRPGQPLPTIQLWAATDQQTAHRGAGSRLTRIARCIGCIPICCPRTRRKSSRLPPLAKESSLLPLGLTWTRKPARISRPLSHCGTNRFLSRINCVLSWTRVMFVFSCTIRLYRLTFRSPPASEQRPRGPPCWGLRRWHPESTCGQFTWACPVFTRLPREFSRNQRFRVPRGAEIVDACSPTHVRD